MDMQIRAADTTRLDLDQDIVVTELREGNLDDAVVLRLRVPVRERSNRQLECFQTFKLSPGNRSGSSCLPGDEM